MRETTTTVLRHWRRLSANTREPPRCHRFFSIYFDWAYVTKELEGTNATVRMPSSYLREFGDGPGGDAARRQLAQLRGAR